MVAAVVAVSGDDAASSGDRVPRTCGAAGTETLAQNRQARVYLERTRNTPRERNNAATFACLRGQRRGLQLDSPRAQVYAFRPPALVLRGSVLAYGLQRTPEGAEPGGPTAWVVVRDLNDANSIRTIRADVDREMVKIGSVRLGRRGGVAWINCPEPDPLGDGFFEPTCARPGHRDRVYKVDSGTSRRRLLDSGRTIHPGSLRIKGDRISWTKSGRRRAAHLR